MSDFNPQKNERTIEEWTGNRVRADFHPPVGSPAAVIYIAASENLAAINAKLSEIDAMADTFVKKVWTPTAEPDHRPEVTVAVTVKTNTPPE